MMVGNNTKVTGNEVTGSLWNEIFTNIGAVYTGDTFMNDDIDCWFMIIVEIYSNIPTEVADNGLQAVYNKVNRE